MIKDNDIFIEKYRPDKIDEIVGQDDEIKRLKKYVDKKRLNQHLLFVGPPGVGKTTVALVLAKELFGDGWRSDFLEINASDESGIDIIRNKVKDFAVTESLNATGFKIILLDEADSLTKGSQSALRRIMERYSNICKFILTCNYSSSIIEPLISRCAVYRFKGIKPEEMRKRILYICSKENFTIDDGAVDSIIYNSEGDLRNAINSLQTASLLGNHIIIDNVYKASGLVKDEYIEEMIRKSLLTSNDIQMLSVGGSEIEDNVRSRIIINFDLLDYLMLIEGHSSLDILKQMYRVVMKMNIKAKMKVHIIDKIGETDFRISEGADERLQMRALLASIIAAGGA